MNNRKFFFFLLSIVAIAKLGYGQENESSGILKVIHGYYQGLRASDEIEIQKYEAPRVTVVMSDGREVVTDGSHLARVCAWERALHHESNYQILKVDKNKVTVLLRENNDFYRQLGAGTMTEVTDCVVESGKIVRLAQRLFLHYNNQEGKLLNDFRSWLLAQPDLHEPQLIASDQKLLFTSESAPQMVHWLKRWSASGGNPRGETRSSEKIVTQYCAALRSLDPKEFEKYLSDSFAIVDMDQKARLYSRENAIALSAWEKGMNTKWDYEIIEVHGDSIKVVLREESDFYTLLGIGPRTEISEFVVRDGKIDREIGVFGPVNEHGTQEEAYGKFNAWVQAQHVREPALIASDHKLIFDGNSAPHMAFWLKKWSGDKR